MIPADIAGRLQLPVDASVTRTPQTQQVADALAELVPGQRVLAEVQALLPNGAYRALINQRDVTLALPFSAKAGDALELEVVDNDGKLALALVSRRTDRSATESGERPAVETTLSRTGNFIAGLLPRREEGEQARPAPLNANQPIAPSPPTRAADLVPLLKQAIAQSGMFYEAHQSQWVGNTLPVTELLKQPQGRLSPLLATPPPEAADNATPVRGAASEHRPATTPVSNTAADTGRTSQSIPTITNASDPALLRAPLSPTQPVQPELLPLVQQQLEALATQTYVWQGQAWPGQPMQWEIVEEDGGRKPAADAEVPPWQTRLTLTMPQLGEVRAALRLVGGEVTLALSAESGGAALQLSTGSEALRQQLDAAGLKLANFSVGRHDQDEE